MGADSWSLLTRRYWPEQPSRLPTPPAAKERRPAAASLSNAVVIVGELRILSAMTTVTGVKDGPDGVRVYAGWWQSCWALICGTFFAVGILLPLALGFNAVHLLGSGLGTNDPGLGGFGWPWRIEGVWSAVADLAPHLLIGLVLANTVTFFLPLQTDGRRSVRWPIGACALLLGWPTDHGGYLELSSGAVFVAMWVVTRSSSATPRRAFHLGLRQRLVLLTGFVGLMLVSVSYAALRPITLYSQSSGPLTLNRTTSSDYWVQLDNTGPLTIRVTGMSFENADGISIPRIGVLWPGVAPATAGLYRTIRSVKVSPGQSATIFPVITAPRDSSGFAYVSGMRVHYTVAGIAETEAIPLSSSLAMNFSTSRP